MSRVETPAELIERLHAEYKAGDLTAQEFWDKAMAAAPAPEMPEELTTASGVELTRVWPG